MRKQPPAPLVREQSVRRREKQARHRVPDHHRGEAEAVQRPCAARLALERPQEEQRGDEDERDHHRVAARLLRPADEERARREEKAGRESDPAIEEPTAEHDEQRAGEHRGDDGREAQRPLRRPGDERPRLHHEIEEEVVPVRVERERVVEVVDRERLVDPERRSSEPEQPEHERDSAHDDDVEHERARPCSREEPGACASVDPPGVERLAHHAALSVVAQACISGGHPSRAQHAPLGGGRVPPFVAIPPGRWANVAHVGTPARGLKCRSRPLASLL